MEEKRRQTRPRDEDVPGPEGPRDPLSGPADLRILLGRCRRGDREAFGRLFEHFGDYVYSVALRLLGDPAGAADATQEVFLKLLSRIGQFREEAGFRTWLFRIVVNTVRDGQRRRLPVPANGTEELLHLVDRSRAPRDPAAALDAGLQVRAALTRLDPIHREPLALRFAGGLTYDEIAAVLDVPAGTVASRISRALRQLHSQMRESSAAPRRQGA